jgi:hypothetical protein
MSSVCLASQSLRIAACDAGMVGGAADVCAKAARGARAVAPRRPPLAVRSARRDIASADLFTEFPVKVASRSMISSRIEF